ncbi:MAG: bifunctional DNA-formamidopyrimidine glycosylase/DNA-(apurinic or apyrimidinic site) lyase [Pseudomonadales bacterium]|nr:bifunctional DNA-formamidopyrimidine glycosylase/DNA-(apurinic or apyrimidinic site) lyase [Pseudomonadales bacterium]
MPELPEVETTRRGIAPHLLGQTILAVTVRQRSLRWPVPTELNQNLRSRSIDAIARRGKYLLLYISSDGNNHSGLLIHLGMSGSLRIVASGTPAARHDHVDFLLGSGQTLRYTDPRRFGCILWCDQSPAEHPLLSQLGPEPLTPSFSAEYLHRHSRGRSTAIKSFIMDSHVVVGVGNIYANEALFLSGIHPARAAGRISAARYARLHGNIQTILDSAIAQGGTTLRDFVGGDGKPGYFRQSLLVYGRKGQSCTRCLAILKEIRINQRSTVFCPTCQR